MLILLPPAGFILFLTAGYSSNQAIVHLINVILLIMGLVWIATLVAYFKGVARSAWEDSPRERAALANYYMTCPSCGYDCSSIPDFTACPECGLSGTADSFRKIWTNPKAR